MKIFIEMQGYEFGSIKRSGTWPDLMLNYIFILQALLYFHTPQCRPGSALGGYPGPWG